MNAEPVLRVLASIGARYALIGGHALAARGYPRFTVDVDLLTDDERVLDPAPWRELADQGAAIDPRRGEPDDPLRGVVHVLLADMTDVDVVVARWKWEAAVIERAEVMRIWGLDVPVPMTSDLILMKLAAGGYLDLHDAAALLEVGDRERVVGEVNAHVNEVRPDVRERWQELLRR
jgi:hypothetical protein